MQKRDLTSGSISGNLIYMALPTMFGFFAQTFYSIVDMIWIGLISPEAVAGVTIYGTIFVVVFVFNDIIGTSSISLISQSYGEGNLERTERIVEQTITFKGLIAIAAGLFMIIGLDPLVRLFTSDPSAYQAAMDYGYIRTFFLPIMFSSYTVNTAMRCIGDSKKPLYLMIVVSVLNIVLDPLLMFDVVPYVTFFGHPIKGFNMGVYGAALATVISSTVAFLLAFWILLTGKTYIKIRLKGLLRLDREIDKKLMTIGLPNGLEGFNRNIANFLLFKMIAFYGTNFLAAYGIALRLLDLCFMPMMGLNMGGSTIIGQNLGNGDLNRARKTVHATIRLGVISLVIVNILVFLFSDQLMNIFIHDEAVIKTGSQILKLIMPAMIFLAIMFGFGTAFSGSGYNKPFLYASIASRWLVLLPIAFYTTYVLKTGYVGLLAAYIISEFVDMLIIAFFYKRGTWETMRV